MLRPNTPTKGRTVANSVRTLVVVRHAKAEADATTDHGRPLAARGVRDARAAGHWLAAELAGGSGRTEALVSTASRARMTWSEIADTVSADVRMLDGLYEAGADEVVGMLALLDKDVQTAIVVGHNPTLQTVVFNLATRDGADYETMSERGFPTAAVAVLDVPVAWHDLAPETCPVRAFHVPRG